jgi:RNA polymerase sigma factor (sigma-70 family)
VLRRLVGLLSTDADATPAEASRSNPETMWIASESLRQVDLAISALPRNLREAFILTAFEGLSHGEAAALLGVSVKSVETRVYRARRRLTQVIARADLALLISGATAP